MASSEDVLLQIPHVKYKKDDGTLYFMSERVAWIQRNRDTVSISQNYADIKNQKISSEGKSKIQLQIVLHNNAAYTFHFVNPQGQASQIQDRNQAKELLQSVLPNFRKKVNEEFEEKNRLLSDNPKLLKLYKDLVMGQIITSEEFWQTHAQSYLQTIKPVSKHQEPGVSSGFLTGIQPETDGANGIRYNLTKDIILSIFKTYPAVKKKHIECVPSQMTENQFWAKFFQSHYFHRDRLPNVKDLFSDCAKAEDKEMKRELERVKNMTSDVMNILEDSEKINIEDSNLPGGSEKGITPQGIYRNMIKRFNHHSIMVLKACERNSGSQSQNSSENMDNVDSKKPNDDTEVPNKKAKLMEKIILEDLQEEESPNYQKLKLTKIDRYLNGPIADHKIDQVTSEEALQVTAILRKMAANWGTTKAQILDSKTATSILVELSPGGKLMKSDQLGITTQTLTPEVEAELRTVYYSLNELMRHFWACFPTTTPALEEKLTKTYEALKKFEQLKIQQMNNLILNNHLQPGKILAHINALLTNAYEKYSSWLQRNRR